MAIFDRYRSRSQRSRATPRRVLATQAIQSVVRGFLGRRRANRRRVLPLSTIVTRSGRAPFSALVRSMVARYL